MDLAVELVREEARRKDLRLDVRLGCRDEEITADRRACHQILLNLLSTPLKFTEVGVVTLESRRVGQMVEFSVSDTGIGIAESDLERLGRPFVQVSSGTTRRYHGTGLGLSLVKGLVELHGGDHNGDQRSRGRDHGEHPAASEGPAGARRNQQHPGKHHSVQRCPDKDHPPNASP